MEYGLALAGGGTRAAAHVGVLKALEEAKLLPQAVAGTSAGSIVAGLFASGMGISDMEEAVRRLTEHGRDYLDPDYGGLLEFMPQLLAGKKVSLSGMIKGDKLLAYLCDLTKGKKLDQSVVKLVIPAVDLMSGETVCFTNVEETDHRNHVQWEWDGYLCEAMMASSSVPAIFAPRKMGRYLLVDGGVTDLLPADLLQAARVHKVLAVDISRDYVPPADDSVVETAFHAFSVMSSRLAECGSGGEVLRLKPPLRPMAGLLTFDTMEDSMDAAYRYTRKMIPMIRQALGYV